MLTQSPRIFSEPVAAAIGARIDKRRKELKLTIAELADRSDLPEDLLSEFIQGFSYPGFDDLAALAEVLEVNIAHFFGMQIMEQPSQLC